jgi:hypothetical protein
MLAPNNVSIVNVMLGDKSKPVLLPNGTKLFDAKKAFATVLGVDASSLEFLSSTNKELHDGESVEVSLSREILGGTEQQKSTRTPLPSQAGKKAVNTQRPDHVVMLMLENRSFDHMLGKVRLDASHPGWDRRTDLQEAIPVVWPDPSHNSEDVQGTQLGLDLEGSTEIKTELGSDCGFCKSRLKTENFDLSYEIEKKRPLALKAEHTGSTTTCSYNEDEIKCLAYLAKEYCTSDQYFCALAGPTVPNRMLALTCDTPADSHHNPEGGAQLMEYLRGMKSVPSLL